MDNIQLYHGDITTLAVECIVNAANPSLLGGGGVDGAIHQAAGPKLLDACRSLSPIEVGQAVITEGFLLPAKYVIHTAGPIWRGGKEGESANLKACYVNSLQLAISYNIQTIAFPAISTGVYRYPIEEAAHISIESIRDVLKVNSSSIKVTLVSYNRETYNALKKAY